MSMILGLVLIGPTSAGADTDGGTDVGAAACGSSNTGWFPYNVRTRTIQLSGRTVQLHLTNDQVSDHSYADVWWDYESGDLTWVDRSYDGGATWTQCGPFNRSYSNTLRNVGNWMRACYRPHDYPQSYCTGWYYDAD